MVYFLKQTANKPEWHIHSSWIQFPFTFYNPLRLLSYLSGLPVSLLNLIIQQSEIGQPDYLNVNTCNNVPEVHTNVNIDENTCLSDSI